MRKESLEKAKELLLETIGKSNIEQPDKLELILNIYSFLTNYDEDLKVLKNNQKRKWVMIMNYEEKLKQYKQELIEWVKEEIDKTQLDIVVNRAKPNVKFWRLYDLREVLEKLGE